MNTTIQTQPYNTPLKFLGCWYTATNTQSIISKIIVQETLGLTNIIQTKQITDKQTSYVINNVIIPIFEYRIHNIVISHNTCNKILSKYLTVAKHKSKLPVSAPNSTMLNHNIYGIKNVWDIQLQHHISNFLLRLNKTDLLGVTTQIRLQQLQNNLWSTTNILQHPNPLIDGANKHTTTFQIIQLLRHMQFTITAYSIQPYTLTYPYTPIETLLHTHPDYNNFKKQLRNKYILYLEQLTSFDNSTLLDWTHISPKLGQIPTGRKPKWFTILENKIITDNHTRQIDSSLNLPSSNSLSFTTGHYNSKSKPWLITFDYNYQEIIIGKACKYNTNDNTISITHWLTKHDPSYTSLYPLPTVNCTRCT
jgi:hypothetical protein